MQTMSSPLPGASGIARYYTVKVKKLHPDAVVPKTWSEHAIGFDLHAYVVDRNGRPGKVILPPRNTRVIDCGIAIETPASYFVSVWSRSGLAKRSVFVANSP